MKNCILLLCWIGFCSSLNAQNTPALSNSDKKEIRSLARDAVATNLPGLFNTLTFEDANTSELREAVENSYLPSNSQLFYSDAAPVEDDLNPQNTELGRGKELRVGTYLANLSNAAFYAKTADESIVFSEISVSDVKIIGEHPFIKAYFKSHFKGEHTSKKPYRPVLRVAELRAELAGKKWQVFITRIAFYDPAKETTAAPSAPAKPKIDSVQATAVVALSPQPDTIKKVIAAKIEPKTPAPPVLIEIIEEKKPEAAKPASKPLVFTEIPKPIEIPLLQKSLVEDKAARAIKYKRGGRTWLVLSALAVVSTAATYFSLKGAHNSYKTAVTNDYDLWRSLSRDVSLAKSSTPLSFTEFARPGIYAVYGGAAFSLLSLNLSFNKFKKSKK